MNRYFLYLVFLNMMTNTIIFVPKILISDWDDGTVMGTLVALPLGMVLTVFFTKQFGKFPGKDLPELLGKAFGTKFKNAVLLCIIAIWFTAGLITLLGFIDILNRFINPEISKFNLVLPFLAAVLFVIQLSSNKIMYLLELILFLNTPLIMFIVFKAFTSEYLSWDSIFEVGTHWFSIPSFKSIGAASYSFSGYANVLIFNRLLKEKVKTRNFVLVFFLAVFNLFSTFLLPIGIHGADGAGEYLYPWIATADSLRMVYGPIERVIFIFLMFYLSITLLSVSVHWHVAYEALKGLTEKQLTTKQKFFIKSSFSVLILFAVLKINALHLIKIAGIWLQIRIVAEILFIPLLFFMVRRLKK